MLSNSCCSEKTGSSVGFTTLGAEGLLGATVGGVDERGDEEATTGEECERGEPDGAVTSSTILEVESPGPILGVRGGGTGGVEGACEGGEMGGVAEAGVGGDEGAGGMAMARSSFDLATILGFWLLTAGFPSAGSDMFHVLEPENEQEILFRTHVSFCRVFVSLFLFPPLFFSLLSPSFSFFLPGDLRPLIATRAPL